MALFRPKYYGCGRGAKRQPAPASSAPLIGIPSVTDAPHLQTKAVRREKKSTIGLAVATMTTPMRITLERQ